ncbi:hypothetical protein [Pelosinus sp. sgz500959]|uniref:hypothetical protein n=1 Tax=Pelosinus sp. sgz500959 TaxID=3242472 RepID=UPI003671EF35
MVKIISLLCAFFLLSVNPVLAISSIDVNVIREAQSYGKIKAQDQLKDFLLPWISYEEKAVKLDETAEHAYLYTAFLLMATDSREKSLNGQSVSLLDSERILADYTNLLSFSVALFGEKQDFAQNANVILKQNNKIIKAYQVNIPVDAEKISKDEIPSVYKGQCYFYFVEKDIDLDSPISLVISTSDKKEHIFYFDMAKIR